MCVESLNVLTAHLKFILVDFLFCKSLEISTALISQVSETASCKSVPTGRLIRVFLGLSKRPTEI